ncbi:hypothetical protein L3V82_13055 [Thiotrichales bacterium 19S3-7]|nr:hypothetical protein [Thiotrichales bacterium 19S3-7]MCF6803099.1 hypothetical protein [Thiotrichales bacterium 19S3-11]
MSKDDATSLLYSIVNMNNFFDKNIQFKLTDKSIELFNRAQKGQGFIGLVELPNINEDQRQVVIHLVPAFGKNDGLFRVEMPPVN